MMYKYTYSNHVYITADKMTARAGGRHRNTCMCGRSNNGTRRAVSISHTALVSTLLPLYYKLIITQYGNTVYIGMAMGGSAL